MPVPRNRVEGTARALMGRLVRYKPLRALFAPKGAPAVRVGALDSTTLPYWEDYLRLPAGGAQLPGQGSYLFVAVGAQRIVGHVSIHRQWERTDLGIPGWWLTGLDVDPLWRGRGVGRRLVEQAMGRWEADNPGEPLYLVVKATNRPAVSLFEREGFVRLDAEEWSRILMKVYRDVQKGRWAYQIMRRPSAERVAD